MTAIFMLDVLQRGAYPFCLFSNQKRSPFLIRSNWSRIIAEKTGPGPSRDSSSPPGKSSSFEMSLLYSSATSWSNCWSTTKDTLKFTLLFFTQFKLTFCFLGDPVILFYFFLPVGWWCWALQMSLQVTDWELFWSHCNYVGQSLSLFGRSRPPDLTVWTLGVRTWSLSGCKSDRRSEYEIITSVWML